MTTDRRTVSLRIRGDLLDRVGDLCHEHVLGRNLVVERAIEELLDRLDAGEEVPVISEARRRIAEPTRRGWAPFIPWWGWRIRRR